MGWRKTIVLVLLTAGCSSFVAADGAAPAPMGTETEAAAEATGGSTSPDGTSGNAEGTGGGTQEALTSTSDEPPMVTSSSSSSTTGDTNGSSETTTAAQSSPFESSYTGSFTAECQIRFFGTLAIDVDAAGIIAGTATASGQSAAVNGTVDDFGTVDGQAAIPGIGQCDLAGSVAEGSLIGQGSFNCPSAACSGTWTLAGI